jgi:hypothetical protein
VNLAQAIQSAQEKNEQALASQIAAPKIELESDDLVLVRRFADFCKAKGVPFLPAAPATVALFLRTENLGGANYKRIFATAQAIELLHDQAMLSNPVATFVVRNELARIYEINPPRSWAKVHRPLFASLPIEVRQVVENYADLSSKAVRKAQNEAAELRHTLQSLEKGNLDGTAQQETNQ